MKVVNRSKVEVVFRDDAGKHVLKPGQSIEVTGDQHIPMALAIPGLVAVK